MPAITIVELQVDSGSNNTNPDHDDVLLYAPALGLQKFFNDVVS
jgi:hypothetical protein